jgi:hypothetical protein
MCSASHITINCLADAEGLAKAINEARDIRLKQQGITVETEMARI